MNNSKQLTYITAKDLPDDLNDKHDCRSLKTKLQKLIINKLCTFYYIIFKNKHNEYF